MAELKKLAPEAVPRAIEKAERYRFLNEPAEAESICLDVLQIEPQNQQALIVLILALTDQFQQSLPAKQAQDLLPRLQGEYERAYYAGIIYERLARAQFDTHRNTRAGYHWLHAAMECYEKAESLRPPGNDDAILRWNTCARLQARHPHLAYAAEAASGTDLLE
jgi:hypothetical protein